MKKYFVIGNPIEHSLSPKLHNYWFKKNKIEATYDKKLIKGGDLENIVSQVKKGEIEGINVTIPFKRLVISFLDELTPEANESQSVNTIYKENKKVIGHNTDIDGFELGLRYFKYTGMTGELIYKNGKLYRKSLKAEIEKGIFKSIGY